MKFINSLPSIIDQEQRKNLVNFILKQSNLREIVWDNVVEDKIKELESLKLKQIPFLAKFDEQTLLNQMEDIFINVVALVKENDLISDRLSIHEMIRKDEVKNINSTESNSIELLVEATLGNRQLNVELKNNRVELTPTNVLYYEPSSISVQYYPAFLKYIQANTPDIETLSSGTIRGFWAADIYTDMRTDVGAIIEFNYDSPIDFTDITIRTIGKYNAVINTIEYYNLTTSTWEEISITESYNKEFYFNFESPFTSNKVRIDIRQPHYDYVWDTILDDAYLIRDYVIAGRDLNVIKNDRIEKVMEGENPTLIERYQIDNKYKYQIGAYNIQVFRKTYNNVDGIFRSKRFTVNDVINNIKLEVVEETPGDSSISHKIVYFDNSFIDITPSEDTSIDKAFLKIEKFSGLQYNKIELSNYPFIDSNQGRNISVIVNAEATNFVDSFTYESDLQFMVSGNNVFLNRISENDIITIQYWHKTPYITVESTLNNGDDGVVFFTPRINEMDVYINGDIVS